MEAIHFATSVFAHSERWLRNQPQKCTLTRPCCLTGKMKIILTIIASACSVSSVLFAPYSLTDETVLFHREKHICRISGISNIIVGDYDFHTRQAPWDEHTAIMRSTKNSCLNNELATALQYEDRDLSGSDRRLMCLVVHARCWQLLCKHRIWSLCGGDIKLVMRALYRRRLPKYHQPLTSFKRPLPMLDDGTEEDPFYSNRVQSIIRQAGRRTRKQYHALQHRHKMIYLSRLPPEILLMIANLLPSTDTAAVQKAIGSYLGDIYWRSRIPDIFYEARDLTTESLNWEYLCLELERLKSRWAIYYSCRDDIWDSLDRTVQLIGEFNDV
ncbi:hypothetical protein ASPVEDRAFT_301237 [Aspergillus versicolor CBS 583.65]|uniref:F-box domain-containing protein n=1 Tax=Aspergillus versicolor CBS 583.65 TaxID=1036611 RepID=A0A1L9P7U1_ASPVE|nr:uncharacterized protein ASPVEDRAFT_301237 [Aspergillus versicolor CBS 583.65]OJI97600.1 hypothetical protein ASPVEDRAFT_301237 [Aspergillus versicolor CBS 583.65]